MDNYNLLKELIYSINNKKEKKYTNYVNEIFQKSEIILKNYFDMFSTIRINVISGKFNVNDVINYLLEREYELKDMRILIRSFLKDKYYRDVNDSVIVDKSNHTINSYIKFCQSLLLEDSNVQKNKIINMTNGILQDLTTSWETVCDCYRLLSK